MIEFDGGRFTYAYDAADRIETLINPQGDRTTYSYDSASRRTVKRLANGTRASCTSGSRQKKVRETGAMTEAGVHSSNRRETCFV